MEAFVKNDFHSNHLLDLIPGKTAKKGDSKGSRKKQISIHHIYFHDHSILPDYHSFSKPGLLKISAQSRCPSWKLARHQVNIKSTDGGAIVS